MGGGGGAPKSWDPRTFLSSYRFAVIFSFEDFDKG